jgi:hypothetical protein
MIYALGYSLFWSDLDWLLQFNQSKENRHHQQADFKFIDVKEN